MILPVIVIAAFVLLTGFRVAQEYQRGVVFRLGRYTGLRGPGLYWIIPLGIDRAVTIDIRTRTVSAEQKDVELPADMQEVMAMQAQAIREKRARIIKADRNSRRNASWRMPRRRWQVIRWPSSCGACKWSRRWAPRTTAPPSW